MLTGGLACEMQQGGFWWQLMDGKGMQIMPESAIQAKNGKASNN